MNTPPDTGFSRFNISRWALEHAPLTRYLMVVLMVLGFVAYFQLGQDEDPPFTIRAMVVQAYWPGASAQASEVSADAAQAQAMTRYLPKRSPSGPKTSCARP